MNEITITYEEDMLKYSTSGASRGFLVGSGKRGALTVWKYEGNDTPIVAQQKDEGSLKFIFGRTQTYIDSEGEELAKLMLPALGKKPILEIGSETFKGKIRHGIVRKDVCIFNAGRKETILKISPKNSYDETTILVEHSERVPEVVALLVAVRIFEARFSHTD